MRAVGSWLFIAVVIFGRPAAALAKCAMPSPGLAPAAGKVPKNPVLWLFLPAWQSKASGPQLRATMKGIPLPIRVTADTKTQSLHTYRVEVTTNLAGELTVESLDEHREAWHTWSLVVDPAWQADANQVTPVKVGREVSQWTCSHTRTRNLHFAATAWAYRVVAAPNQDALAKGQGKSFVVPRAMELLWGRSAKVIGDQANLALGHCNCFGLTFDWSSGAVVANVLALLPDGSERVVNGTPLEISPP